MHAQQMLQQLRTNYLAELPDHVNELEQLTLSLAKQSDEYPQQYGELYRKVHSLKGGAGTYGLQIVSTICHQLEDSLAFIANDKTKVNDQFLDRCMAYFDLIRLAIRNAVQGKNDLTEIESALAAMRQTAAQKRLTVLLVEPSKVNAKLYFGVLKDLPIQFSVVDSGYAALGLLLHSHFDLLITGHETTSLNGMALIAAIRLNQGTNHNIHAILLTSTSNLQIPTAAQPVTLISRNVRAGAMLLNEVQQQLQSHPLFKS
jgi:CheY-like chemotaxis protein/HPt (histidine-containing phosphotransfer) domain-containing protein